MSDRSDSPSETPENAPDQMEALAASDAANVMDAFDRNRNKILIGFAAAALIICAILVATQMKKQKHLAAGSAYSVALDKKEIASFDAVVVDYPGTIAAGNAMLSKADLQVDQGKPEDARSTLEEYIANFSGHPRHAQGLFALGNLYHISGDAAKAKEYYLESIDDQPDGELTPLARIRLGDLALEAGDEEGADQRYQESYTLHPGNRFVEYAEEKIALLKVGNPPKVKRPEPPKPEPAPETPGEGEAAPAPNAGKAKAPAPKGKGKEKGKGNANQKAKGKAAPKGNASGEKAKSAPKAPAKAKTPAPQKGAPKGPAKAKTPAPAKGNPAPKADAPKAPKAPKAPAAPGN